MWLIQIEAFLSQVEKAQKNEQDCALKDKGILVDSFSSNIFFHVYMIAFDFYFELITIRCYFPQSNSHLRLCTTP